MALTTIFTQKLLVSEMSSFDFFERFLKFYEFNKKIPHIWDFGFNP